MEFRKEQFQKIFVYGAFLSDCYENFFLWRNNDLDLFISSQNCSEKPNHSKNIIYNVNKVAKNLK